MLVQFLIWPHHTHKSLDNGRRGQERKKQVAALPREKLYSNSFLTCMVQVLHTSVVIVAVKVLIFLRGTVHTIWLSLFVIFLGIFSESKLWAQHCVNTISRFTSLAELKHRNPWACSTLSSVDIAENLRVVYEVDKGRKLAMPSTYIF